MATTWRNEFSADYAVPAAIEAAVAAGTLEDVSWSNDACPCFAPAGYGVTDEIFRLWVDHPDSASRECDGPRFTITNAADDFAVVFSSETDAAGAVAALLAAWATYHEPDAELPQAARKQWS